MDGTLLLNSFEIEGFRGIRHLSLPELGRVNLFVGSNNAGKTALLEAVRFYAHHDVVRTAAAIVLETAREHSELRPVFSVASSRREFGEDDVEAAITSAETLFYGGRGGNSHQARMGPAPLGENAFSLTLLSEGALFGPDSPLLEVGKGRDGFVVTLDAFLRRIPMLRRVSSRALFIPSGGFDLTRVPDLWDEAVLEGHEERIESVMRIIVPEFERVFVVGEGGRRSILVKERGLNRPTPLRSLGDGAVRIFGLALALVLAEDKVVLIDEVENGLHFTVQDEVWRALFSISRQLNVQVLATTHSWDAVVGFQWAANLDDDEGFLYRLERAEDGKVRAVRYTEEDVAIAAEQRIEVR